MGSLGSSAPACTGLLSTPAHPPDPYVSLRNRQMHPCDSTQPFGPTARSRVPLTAADDSHGLFNTGADAHRCARPSAEARRGIVRSTVCEPVPEPLFARPAAERYPGAVMIDSAHGLCNNSVFVGGDSCAFACSAPGLLSAAELERDEHGPRHGEASLFEASDSSGSDPPQMFEADLLAGPAVDPAPRPHRAPLPAISSGCALCDLA